MIKELKKNTDLSKMARLNAENGKKIYHENFLILENKLINLYL